MAYIGRGPTNSGEFIILDDISSGFDGSDTSFTLTVGTTEVTPAAANVTIALDGVIQTATSAYSVTGSTINFTEAPESGQEFHGVLAGQSQYISDSSITNQHISGTANISGSKINTDFGSQNIQIIHVTASGDISADSMSIPVLSTMSSSVATRFDSRETDMTLATASIALNESNMTLATASIAAITASVSTINDNMTLATASIAAITASLGQPVNTDSNVTFGVITSGDINSSGTITATEIHTTFVSSSIAVASGSNNFGDATDDHHSFTGSLSISGSGTITGSLTVNGDLIVKDNVDFNGDLDVDGTTNLDVVDIDGAVDMASTLTTAANITVQANDPTTINAGEIAGDNDVLGINIKNTNTGDGTGGMLKFMSDNGDALTAIAHNQSANTSGEMLFFTENSGTFAERMKIASDGKVSMFSGGSHASTAANAYADNLVIRGSNDGDGSGITIFSETDEFGTLYFGDGGTGNQAYRGYVQYSHAADTLQLGAAGGTKLFIGSGSVGFGTTEPGLVNGTDRTGGGDTGVLHLKGTVPRILFDDDGDTPQFAIAAQDFFSIDNIPDDSSSEGQLIRLNMSSDSPEIRTVVSASGTSYLTAPPIGAAGSENYTNYVMRRNRGTGINYEHNATSRDIRIIAGGNGVVLSGNGSSFSAISSDERKKQNWSNFVNASDKISTLTKIGQYQRLDPDTNDFPKGSDENGNQTILSGSEYGLSANEVQTILPHAVHTNKDGYLGLNYQDVFVLGIKAIQELTTEINTLKELSEKIELQQKQIEELKEGQNG